MRRCCAGPVKSEGKKRKRTGKSKGKAEAERTHVRLLRESLWSKRPWEWWTSRLLTVGDV
jgi:hypothetical protein